MDVNKLVDEADVWTREGAAKLVGDIGEEATANALREMGYDVTWVGGQSWDLLVNDRVTVEVKTALPTEGSGGNKERWQFMLYKRGRGKPLDEHVLILRCHANTDPDSLAWFYVIPGHLNGMGSLTKIDITSRPDKYSGKWAPFLNAWQELAGIVALAEKEDWPNLQNGKEIPF